MSFAAVLPIERLWRKVLTTFSRTNSVQAAKQSENISGVKQKIASGALTPEALESREDGQGTRPSKAQPAAARSLAHSLN